MRIINIAQAGPLDTAPPVSSLLGAVLKFAVSLIGGVAVLVIVIAGVMYIMSGGNQAQVQKAKSTLIAGIVGLVVAIISYIIVTEIIGLF